MIENWIAMAAAKVDDGWLELETAWRRLAEAKEALPPMPGPVVSEHDLGKKMIGVDGFDLITEARFSVERDVDRGVWNRAFGTLTVTKASLTNRRDLWISGHQPQLCNALQTERVRIAERISPLVAKLAPVATTSALGQHPELAQAFADLSMQLDEWKTAQRIHHQITGLRSYDGRAWDGRWPDLDWIGSYVSAWPRFYKFPSHSRDHDGVTTGDVPPDWSTENVLDHGRAIARFDVWTPTSSEFEDAARHISREATPLIAISDKESALAARQGPRPAKETIHVTTTQPEPLPAHLGLSPR